MVLTIVFLSGIPSVVSAHNLIPPELTTYIEKHPSATPEEIKAFADAQSPEFARKFRDGTEIVRIVQSQQTSFFDKDEK